MAIIAFSGISGCGKSTLSKLLSKELGAVCINEPEEQDWPEVIKNPEKYDQATSFLAFRQIWAKQFTDAHIANKFNKLVFVDSYFFKINSYYLGKPKMDWLLKSDSPYLETLKNLNKLDQELFYDADCVVLFDVNLEDWKLFLKSRQRNWDKTPGFEEAFSITKKYVEDATIEHCKNKKIKLIKFNHKFGDFHEQARLLKNILIQKKFI